MKIIKTEFTTREIGKPANWNTEKDGECEALPVVDINGVQYSIWQFSWKEIFKLLLRKEVILGVHGCCHPVVSLGVHEGFKSAED